MAVSREDMIGAWHLVDTYIANPDGTRTATMGENPEGVIMYTPDGYMSAITRRRDRALPADAGEAGKAAAFDSYLNYAGRWTLEGDTVHHHVEHALDPNWVGATRARKVDLQGARMVLSGFAADGTSSAVIVWERR